jgi:FkbM family methyltransferase
VVEEEAVTHPTDLLPLPFDFRGQRRIILVQNNILAIAVAKECLKLGQYPLLPYVKNVKVILDVGANIGASALYFASNYPEATIHAFEPTLDALRLLRKNIGGLSEIHVYAFGLLDRHDVLPLYHGDIDSVTNSMFRHKFTTDAYEPMVIYAAGNWLKRNAIPQIDILKIDTEGCEVRILTSILEHDISFNVLYVEFHSEEDRRSIDSMLYPEHSLVYAKIAEPHRGTLCYVSRQLVPEDVNATRIGPVVTKGEQRG